MTVLSVSFGMIVALICGVSGVLLYRRAGPCRKVILIQCNRNKKNGRYLHNVNFLQGLDLLVSLKPVDQVEAFSKLCEVTGINSSVISMRIVKVTCP